MRRSNGPLPGEDLRGHEGGADETLRRGGELHHPAPGGEHMRHHVASNVYQELLMNVGCFTPTEIHNQGGQEGNIYSGSFQGGGETLPLRQFFTLVLLMLMQFFCNCTGFLAFHVYVLNSQ